MKKYYITITLIILIILSILYNILKKDNVYRITNESTVEVSKNIETKNSAVKIYIYDVNTDKINEKEIIVNNGKIIDYDDYVKLILENSEFIKKNMTLLAVYNLKSGDVVIKLSEEFKNLSNLTLNELKNSITKTLKFAFPDLRDVIIQVDTNI